MQIKRPVSPENPRRWVNGGLMLGHRLRRWTNKPPLIQYKFLQLMNRDSFYLRCKQVISVAIKSTHLYSVIINIILQFYNGSQYCEWHYT